ncbi:hypothetical protein MSPP1_003773 [Malassezia sp. CBS 17886]|nr:hypothetical protein MSPP1_003773 [Malassezia sp. CBS 17886]
MGVLGLTRWANETERLISSEITLPVPCESGPALLDGEAADLEAKGTWLIMDAWAWIHYIWHSMNTNVYQGGSFLRFALLLKCWVDALRQAGFQLAVVFDGPRLHQKLGTTLHRTQNYVRLNAKLMRAGPNLRTDHEFEHGRILPPGISECVLGVLDECGVECIMGAEEVDSAIAQLADERSGYVVSRDSDFLILCGNAPHCKGYIPVASFEWIAQDTGASAPEPAADDDGFTTVNTSKRNRQAAAASRKAHLPHLLRAPPLPTQTELQVSALRFRSFSAYKCAAQLQLPMSLLPVFASLVGTERRSSAHADLFGTLLHGVASRMPVFAALLGEQYRAVREAGGAAAPTDTSEAGEAALDMRDPVVRLLAQTFDSLVQYGRKRRGAPVPVSWEMRRAIVMDMHAVALAYMPAQGHEAIDRFMAPTDDAALQAYQKAYWDRSFDQILVSVLLERIYIARVFLEEPDEPAAQRTVVRPLRAYVWSVLLSVWLASHPDANDEEEDVTENVEEVEKAAEALALGEKDSGSDSGAGDGGDGDDTQRDEDRDEEGSADEVPGEAALPDAPEDAEAAHLAALPTVAEYTRTEYSLRRDDVAVLPWVELLRRRSVHPVGGMSDALVGLVRTYEEARDAAVHAAAPGEDACGPPAVAASVPLVPALPEATRMDLWRYAHHAELPELQQLPTDLWPFAAALRYVIVTNHERLGKLRTRHNWSHAEVDAAVYAACVTRRLRKEASPTDLQAVTDAYPSGSPPNRGITLSTSLSFVLETSTLLTQALLLKHCFPHAHACWEPPLFHVRFGMQQGGTPRRAAADAPAPWTAFEDAELHDTLLAVVLHGLEGRLGKARAKTPQPTRGGTLRQRRHHGLLSEATL